MLIASLIVTYGERADFLEKSVNSLVEQGIQSIFVVDNGSPEVNKKKIAKIGTKFPKIFKIIELSRNYGSAGGYRSGLKHIVENYEFDYIWCMDDDNVLVGDALSNLVKNQELMRNPLNVLLSNREDRKAYYNSVKFRDESFLVGPVNSFLGFNIFEKIKNKKNKEHKVDLVSEVFCFPYGGLFISTFLVKLIGYPNIDYFTYCDDTEYSLRAKKSGARIYICFDSVVKDIDFNWQAEVKRNFCFDDPYVLSPAEDKVFYSIRNKIILDKQFRVDNHWVYSVNLIIYVAKMLLSCILNLRFKRLLVIKRAIVSGFNYQVD